MKDIIPHIQYGIRTHYSKSNDFSAEYLNMEPMKMSLFEKIMILSIIGLDIYIIFQFPLIYRVIILFILIIFI